jgi:hypothetical protein
MSQVCHTTGTYTSFYIYQSVVVLEHIRRLSEVSYLFIVPIISTLVGLFPKSRKTFKVHLLVPLFEIISFTLFIREKSLNQETDNLETIKRESGRIVMPCVHFLTCLEPMFITPN